MSFNNLVVAVGALDPEPRNRRWRSLSYCVLDAVWSNGSRYDGVVIPLVRGIAAANGDNYPLVDATEVQPPDPLPLSALLAAYPTGAVLKKSTNAQLTSPRGGILKAEAVVKYAKILHNAGVDDLASATALMADRHQCAVVDQALADVAGDGQNGIRRGYLWMLVGADNLIKPDRMVQRWLERHGYATDATETRTLLARVAEELTTRLERPVTPWMVDHAIWQNQRAGQAIGSPKPAIVVDVEGFPPIKNEAKSLLSAAHTYRDRVELLLAAAAAAARRTGWQCTSDDLALDVTLRVPAARPPADATNYLGGVGDVLQARKTGSVVDLTHLGQLAGFALFDDDGQIQEIAYRVVAADTASYTVQVSVR